MPVPDDDHPSPEFLRALLTRTKTIAVVGASPGPGRPSFGVMAYLHRTGYRLIPVNPTAPGASLFGEPFRPGLAAIGESVDLVNVFRRPEFIPGVVEEVIAIGASALWLQLGIVHREAARRAREAGIAVVMDRCISVEHSRLMR